MRANNEWSDVHVEAHHARTVKAQKALEEVRRLISFKGPADRETSEAPIISVYPPIWAALESGLKDNAGRPLNMKRVRISGYALGVYRG